MKVLVVYGGGSREREVSLRSGKAVGEALTAAGHAMTFFDPGDDTLFRLMQNFVLDMEVVFPVLHGTGGEDGAIQAVLEQLGVPFVGSGSVASRKAFDKVTTLKIVHQAGIIAPTTDLVVLDQLKKHPLAKQPFVLKPSKEGSSVDTFLIRDLNSFRAEDYRQVFDRRGTMLLEQLIEGVELTVGILGDSALPVVEIIPPANANFDYENKYNGATKELCPPVNIPAEVQAQAQAIAYQVHNLLGCRHLSRSDFIWGKDGKLYFLEINTMPGMTNQSLFPKAAATSKITMPQLVDGLVRMAIAEV